MRHSNFSAALFVLASLTLTGSAWGQQQQDPNRKPPETAPRPMPQQQPQRLPQRPPQRLIGNGWTMTTGGWRKGYTPYPGLTIYRNFHFRRYLLNPDESSFVVISPFYLYPNLPPFLDGDALGQGGYQDASVNNPPNSFTQPPAYTPVPADPNQPQPPAPAGFDDSDKAVSALKSAWENQDASGIFKLMPKDGKVTVSVADQTYNLEAKDFQDLITDGITGTKTLKMTVVDQHVDGDQIALQLLHTFIDPWQKTRTVYQSYLLTKEEGVFVIKEFTSDTYNPPPTEQNNGTS